MRLLIRGGSIAAGCGVVRGYADVLRDYYSSRGIEVINCSRAGETSFNGIGSFFDDIDSFRPEILIIHFGIDDAFSAVYRSEFKENLVHMADLARARFHPVILFPTSHTFDNVNDMDAVNIYYRTIREISGDLQVVMVSVHTYWAGFLLEKKLRNADLVQKDVRLPNERGHEIFAEAIARRLDIVLREYKARPQVGGISEFDNHHPIRYK